MHYIHDPSIIMVIIHSISYSPSYSLCVASPARKHTGEAYGSADQSTKKPIVVSLILLKHPLNALVLEAPVDPADFIY